MKTPTGDNSPPEESKAQLLPTRTMIPRTTPTRTTPHQGYCKPLKSLIGTNTCTMGNCAGGDVSGLRSAIKYGKVFKRNPIMATEKLFTRN